MFKFQKATKEKAKLRMAIFGPSGSGKTYSSLSIASGISDKIALIDTERGSASKYADRFSFDVLELPKMDIDTYAAAIHSASGYDVLIIDSLSHAWKELLDEVEKIARAKYRGNTWSAWSDGTPLQRRLVDAILGFDGHIIATMRSKTEWAVSQTDGGKVKPERVGLAPEQGKGIEYEFDILAELNTDHTANIIKDRSGKFQDKIISMPGKDFGSEILSWLNDGSEPLKNKSDNLSDKKIRPYRPEVLEQKIAERVEANKGKVAPGNLGKVIASSLDTTFDGNKTKRYELCNGLIGVSSTKDMSDAQLLALSEWIGAKSFSEPMSEYAISEARSYHQYAMKKIGQQELDMGDGHY